MDLELTETQKLLRNTARSWLETECPWTVVRDVQASKSGYSPEMWQKMAELGWTGLMVPEEYGGNGGSLLDMLVLLEETGRALLPSPFVSTAVIGTQALLLGGTPDQKSRLVPKIAKGELITALAILEEKPDYKTNSINIKAREDGANYVLQGIKNFVRDGDIANYIICVTKSDRSRSKDAVNLLLVDRSIPGIVCTKLNTMAQDRQCELAFYGTRVPKDQILGKPGKGWEIVKQLLEYATLAECAELLGVIQKVLDITVQYAKERIQFGKPIGSFQAVQHRCSNMAALVEASRWMVYYTVWKMEQGQHSSIDISRTKVWVSEAAQRVVREGHQIHGGVGFTLEHPMHLYFRRARTGGVMYGDAELHRKAIADALL